MNYHDFLARKSQLGTACGFEPSWLPDFLFPFQRALVGWAVRKGRAAIFAGCGLGKTPMQLAWAENVVRRADRPVLILTPLAVSHQTVREAAKFGVEAHRSEDGRPAPNITVTNYERLDRFSPDDYSGAVLDESSCIKHWTGARQKAVTRFLSKLPYRLLCSATPAPNDFVEMGTSSEALGGLTHSDMLTTFFRQISDDEKKRRAAAHDVVHSRRLSWRVIQGMGQWALRPHAFEPFWRWVASWARACRKPSDLGDFDDGPFVLPPLLRHDHTVAPRTPPPGFLFTVPAFGLNQERAERRRTLGERSELVAELVKDSDLAVVWCHLNSEGDALERAIPGSVQVKGSDTSEFKEMAIEWFLGERCACGLKPKGRRSNSGPPPDASNGHPCTCGHRSGRRILISKAKIIGLGMNLQCCAHAVAFVDHSFESFYQCVRRCWRFGQERPVRLDVIATEGEVNVRANMERKEKLADLMFDSVIRHMNEAMAVRPAEHTHAPEVPSWLQGNR